MKWIALFSHTGTEIHNISKRLGIRPDKIVTNLSPGNSKINKQLLKGKYNIVHTRSKPEVSDYNRLFTRGDFVTLHGWMRIVPKSVCKDIEIYNLHPGLITQYPELKGADPQSRIYNGIKTYKDVGCVIHQVTEVLDGGQVIMSRSTHNNFSGESQLTDKLHEIAGDMWCDFLSHKLKGETNCYFK